MQKRFLTPFLIVLVLMSYALLRPGARAALRHHQASTTASDAYVQVTSVTVEPPTMHKTQNPNTATVSAKTTRLVWLPSRHADAPGTGERF